LTFYPGEEISAKITLKAKTPSQTNNVITLSVYLVNPLGIVIFDDSKNITLTQTGIVEAFEAIFTYSLPETALRGYYKVYVQASAAGTSRKTQDSFFYNGYVDLENIFELNWIVTLTGQGEVKELKIALPCRPRDMKHHNINYPRQYKHSNSLCIHSARPNHFNSDPETWKRKRLIFSYLKTENMGFRLNFRTDNNFS
jgi:hypothetical protein